MNEKTKKNIENSQKVDKISQNLNENAESSKKAGRKKIINSRPLFYGFLALLLGISTSRYVFSGSVWYIVFDGVVLALFAACCIWAKSFKALVLILAVFSFGLGWFFVGYNSFLGTSYSGTVHVSGRISDDVKYSTYGGQVTVVLKNVQIDGASAGNVRLVISYSGEWAQQIGDVIEFDAEVEQVKLFELGNFNSSYYRDRTALTATISSDEATVTGNSTTLAEKFRLKIKSVLYENLDEANASTAYTVIFGDKNDLDSDVYSAYNSAGIVHLLTVSGLHVSFLIALIGWVLKKCGVRGWLMVILCALLALVYAYLCGFTPSVLRACIMGIVLLSTNVSGKWHDGLCSIGLAGLVILLISPLSALDLGFLMSFFCVISLQVISPWLSRFFEKFFPKKVASSFGATVGLTLGVAPFVAQFYGGVNILGVFVNLIVIPLFAVLYPLVLLSAILVALLPFMGWVLKVSDFGFWLILKIAAFFGTTKLVLSYQPLDIFVSASAFLALYCTSAFLMISRKARAICVAAAVCVCGALFAVTENVKSAQVGVAYAFYYSQSVIVLTSQSKQTIVIDLAGETFTKRLANELDISSVSALALVQDTTFDQDLTDYLGADLVFRADGGEGYSSEIVCEFGETVLFGDFTLVYRGYGTRLVGLEVCFDNISIFVLKDRTTTSAAIESLPSRSFDYVFLGKQTSNITDFSGRIVTYYKNDLCFSSYQQNGNVLLTENYRRKCLD